MSRCGALRFVPGGAGCPLESDRQSPVPDRHGPTSVRIAQLRSKPIPNC